jgi:hypothetical protein
MTARGEPCAVFEILGDTAMAWYFVMANWSDWKTQPRITLDGNPMKILLDETADAFAELVAVLNRAATVGGQVGKSAVVLLAEIEQRPAPRSRPQDDSSADRAG